MHMRYCGRRSRTRSSSSVFATPPPGSTRYMRWEITGRLRNLETIPLLPPLLRRPPRNRRGTASVVTAEAQLSLQPPPTLSTLVARHRRAALATDEPLSPPTSRSPPPIGLRRLRDSSRSHPSLARILVALRGYIVGCRSTNPHCHSAIDSACSCLYSTRCFHAAFRAAFGWNIGNSGSSGGGLG